MDTVQVKKHAKPISDRIPDGVHRKLRVIPPNLNR